MVRQRQQRLFVIAGLVLMWCSPSPRYRCSPNLSLFGSAPVCESNLNQLVVTFDRGRRRMRVDMWGGLRISISVVHIEMVRISGRASWCQWQQGSKTGLASATCFPKHTNQTGVLSFCQCPGQTYALRAQSPQDSAAKASTQRVCAAAPTGFITGFLSGVVHVSIMRPA